MRPGGCYCDAIAPSVRVNRPILGVSASAITTASSNIRPTAGIILACMWKRKTKRARHRRKSFGSKCCAQLLSHFLSRCHGLVCVCIFGQCIDNYVILVLLRKLNHAIREDIYEEYSDTGPGKSMTDEVLDESMHNTLWFSVHH